jgi:hypothetical protein
VPILHRIMHRFHVGEYGRSSDSCK